MSSILSQINQINEDMDKLLALVLKRHSVLSDSRHYKKLLALNMELENLYRELAYHDPVLYRSIMVTNATRSEIIYETYAKEKG